jgi:hypothetical protein
MLQKGTWLAGTDEWYQNFFELKVPVRHARLVNTFYGGWPFMTL